MNNEILSTHSTRYEHHADHLMCPVCGSPKNYRAYIGYVVASDKPERDLYGCKCECGWTGLVDDLVPGFGPDHQQFLQRNKEVLDCLEMADRVVKGAKTCQRCKHWTRNGGPGIRSSWQEFTQHGECRNTVVSDYAESYEGDSEKFVPHESFGCNKWEVKETGDLP